MTKKIILNVTILVMSVAVFAQTNSEKKFDPNLQRELVIIAPATSYNLNAHSASYVSETQILDGLFEGLFSYTPNTLTPQKALLESYTVSKDRLTWTFTLKKNLKFSDGSAITANSVRDSWISLFQTENAPFASLLDTVVGVEEFRTKQLTDTSFLGITIVDNTTLQLRLKNPMEHLPQVLAHSAFSVVNPNKTVFSGAYKLVSQDSKTIYLEKNNEYWDAQNVAIPSIKIDLSDDTEKNTYLFNVGKADWVIGDIDLQKLFDQRTIKISQAYGTSYFFFRITKSLENEKFRRALLLAVPWNQLRADEIAPATTLVPSLGFLPSANGLVEYDLEKAKKLLKDSKVKASKITLTLDTPNVPYVIKKMEVLKNAWEELGITVIIQKNPSVQYSSSIQTANADLFSYTWIGDYLDPTSFLELFRSNSTLNESNWGNKKYDALLLEASKTEDPKSRYQLLVQAEEILLDSGVIFPISQSISLNIVDTGISGWFENPLNIHPYKYLYFAIDSQLDNLAQAE